MRSRSADDRSTNCSRVGSGSVVIMVALVAAAAAASSDTTAPTTTTGTRTSTACGKSSSCRRCRQ